MHNRLNACLNWSTHSIDCMNRLYSRSSHLPNYKEGDDEEEEVCHPIKKLTPTYNRQNTYSKLAISSAITKFLGKSQPNKSVNKAGS